MDEIVSAVVFRDFVLLVTKQGLIYKGEWDAREGRIVFRLESQINEIGR